VVPWTAVPALNAPYAPPAETGRPPFELETLLRIHFVRQWFGLSDLATEEALFETALYIRTGHRFSDGGRSWGRSGELMRHLSGRFRLSKRCRRELDDAIYRVI